jgi:tRNA (guanine37-N1)-methyltransferase
MLTVDLLSLVPDAFPSMLSHSIVGLARQRGLLDVRLHNLRDFSPDRHHKVDDRPFGGGPGMLLRPEPVFRAVEWLESRGFSGRRLLLTPDGRLFDQTLARQLAAEKRFLLLSGHYEGFDERIRTGLPWEPLSLGPFVLSGGEPAAACVIDAVARLLPGALGDPESTKEETFSEELPVEYPQYTRPREFRGMTVPEVLVSGNHAEIRKWREAEAKRRGSERRGK